MTTQKAKKITVTAPEQPVSIAKCDYISREKPNVLHFLEN